MKFTFKLKSKSIARRKSVLNNGNGFRLKFQFGFGISVYRYFACILHGQWILTLKIHREFLYLARGFRVYSEFIAFR